jgi:hypothetical protein
MGALSLLRTTVTRALQKTLLLPEKLSVLVMAEMVISCSAVGGSRMQWQQTGREAAVAAGSSGSRKQWQQTGRQAGR